MVARRSDVLIFSSGGDVTAEVKGRIGMMPSCFGGETLSRSAKDFTEPVLAGLETKQEIGSVRSTRLCAVPDTERCRCFGSGASGERVGKNGVEEGPDGNDVLD